MHKESVELNKKKSEYSEYDSRQRIEEESYGAKEDAIEQEIRAVIQSKYWLLRFPKSLEATFTAQYISRAIQLFHFRAPLLFLLLLVENIGIYQVLPQEIVPYFYSINTWTAFVIFMSATFSYVSGMNRWYEWYIGVGGIVALAVSSATANMGGGESVILTYAGTMYIVLVLYSFVSLRFYAAMIVGWGGGACGIILAYILGQQMNWKLYNLTYTITSILGMCLAYALDRQERTNFLQACLLQNSVAKGQQLARELNQLSRQDGLTGLANRRHLDEAMNHEWNRALRQQQPLTMMMIDVDFFKNYNDQWGHLAGDECLKQIADLIATLANRSGELAARYGGEEFVLVFPNMDCSEAEQQAKRLLSMLAELALPNPNAVCPSVTVSIGIAMLVPSTITCVEQLLRQADAALYKAKGNGRNRYEFFDNTLATALG